MNRKHATIIAIVLGIAAIFGTFAAVRTAHLGSAARSASKAQLTAEQKRLTAAEQSLRRQLVQAAPRPVAGKAPKTVYVRPAPIVVHLHRHGGEGENESEGGFDD